MSRLVATASRRPGERGREFGRARAELVGASWAGYLEHFEAGGLCGREEVEAWGAEALAAVAAWAPHLAEEIEGIADGAGLGAAQVAALNARTEILAKVARRRRLPGRGECTVMVAVESEADGPLGAQTWDWHDEFATTWLVWGLEEESGMRVQTLTEAGVLAKLGVNSAGIAVLLNVLHHEDDASVALGVPIHALLRRILGESETIFDALRLLGSFAPAASSAVTLVAAEGGEGTALTAELRPGARPGYVLPDERGHLVHTNHFLSPGGEAGDLEPVVGPDSLFRFELMRRRAGHLTAPAGGEEMLAAFRSHLGGGGAVCCHPEPGAGLGDRYATLATVLVDPAAGRLRFADGGPCEAGPESWTEVFVPPNHPDQEVLDVRAN
ncbi:MAG: peptidase C45 [Actinobacteria bacterium]|nr:peptidase C45 [Actinomycetota bacterium]